MTRTRAQAAINPAQRRLKAFMLTSMALLAMSVALSHARGAGGYGGFNAYVVGIDAGDSLTLRAGHSARAAAIGSIPADAEGVYVNWCDSDGRSSWCDVSFEGMRGWVNSRNLRNVEGGM